MSNLNDAHTGRCGEPYKRPAVYLCNCCKISVIVKTPTWQTFYVHCLPASLTSPRHTTAAPLLHHPRCSANPCSIWGWPNVTAQAVREPALRACRRPCVAGELRNVGAKPKIIFESRVRHTVGTCHNRQTLFCVTTSRCLPASRQTVFCCVTTGPMARPEMATVGLVGSGGNK